MVDDDNNNNSKKSEAHRALIFQGGGSLGAYEAGAYKAINDELSAFIRKRQDREKKEPILFHIVSGTSIGAINAAVLVSYVKENKTWEGSGQRLIDFWEYLSTHSSIEHANPYFTYYWDFWHKLDKRIASGESARRYFSTKEFIFKGVPNVFRPKIPKSDNRFFDPSNTWYLYDNKPLKESLEKFAKFPISTSFENNEPRLLLIAVDVQEGVPVVFDSYEKEDGIRKSGYGRYGPFGIGRYGELEFDTQLEDQSSSNKWEFEHVIRYEDGIKSDFVLASCSVPVNYDYTRLNVENPKLVTGGLNYKSNTDTSGMDTSGSDRSSSSSSSSYSNNNNDLRFFWDGGLLANTPLRETIIAHRYYWSKVRKMHYDMPPLSIGIINLHPKKQEYIPYDYDGVVDRKNDIIYHDKTEFDEFVAVLVSDYQMLAKSLIKLAEDSGVSKQSLRKILKQGTKTVINPTTGPKRLLYDDLLKTCLDVDVAFRLERKNDTHSISNKTFDFSTATIRQLIEDGYEETKPQMKRILYDTAQ